jgi:hypothetical protein
VGERRLLFGVLFDTCPQAGVTLAAVSTHGQVSDNPKQLRPVANDFFGAAIAESVDFDPISQTGCGSRRSPLPPTTRPTLRDGLAPRCP